MNSINTRYLSKYKVATIKQAIKIIDDDLFFEHFGWDGPFNGYFKNAYIKNGIVVKDGPLVQLRHEMRLWLKTRNNARFRRHRKHLARCYGIHKGWLFQAFIPENEKFDGTCNGEYECNREYCEKIAIKLGIEDWEHNHNHNKYGEPIWFDTLV